ARSSETSTERPPRTPGPTQTPPGPPLVEGSSHVRCRPRAPHGPARSQTWPQAAPTGPPLGGTLDVCPQPDMAAGSTDRPPLGGHAGCLPAARWPRGARLVLAAGRLAELVAHQVAQGGAGLAGVLEPLRVGQLVLAPGALDRQADAALGRIHLDDLGALHLARLEHLARILDALVGDLRDVHQALDAGLDLGERRELGELEDLDLDDLADRVVVGVPVPGVLLQLLDAQADLGLLAAVVDVEDHGLDLVT